MIAPLYYRVNGKIFYNELLAQYEEFITHNPVEFVCYDQEYDLVDWTQEPVESMSQLMTQHAHRLRDKYQRLILLWSGGTDSHTIYNTFVGNNIHIDEIIVMHDDQYETFFESSHVDWIRQHHPDVTTKITAKPRFDPEGKALTVNNEDWLFQNHSVMVKFGVGYVDRVLERYCHDSYPSESWAVITGLEPPHITCHNGVWYTSLVSRYFNAVMGFENIECFYLEPMIHLKQSHMAKRALKMFQAKGASIARSDIISTPIGYTALSRMMGRDLELTAGSSYRQKQEHMRFNSTAIELDSFEKLLQVPAEPGLLAAIKQQHPTAQTYVKGLYNLLLERDFCNFLADKNHTKSANLFANGVPITSKPRCLGN